MPLAMSREDREGFLAEPHVGVLAVADGGGPPLVSPVWYAYEPGGLVTVLTGRRSRKAALMRAAGQVSLCAQTEAPPYRYVAVQGPLVEVDGPVVPGERRALARRYLGPELGDQYVATNDAEAAGIAVYRFAPKHWWTRSYADG
jgi:nitroimidazol reductase NimA-like FMN-containing flavoprotein (pyridoxamine 5'-phosphate oxidase superfamily)